VINPQLKKPKPRNLARPRKSDQLFLGLVWKTALDKWAAINIGGKVAAFETRDEAEAFGKTFEIQEYADDET